MFGHNKVVVWLGESDLEKIAWVTVEKAHPKRMGTVHTKGAHQVSIESEYGVNITIRGREKGAYVEEIHGACKYLCQKLKKRYPIVTCITSKGAYCVINVKATYHTMDDVYEKIKSILPRLLKKAYVVPKPVQVTVKKGEKVKFLFAVIVNSYDTLTYMFLRADYLEELQRRETLVCEDAKLMGEKAYYWIVEGDEDAFVNCLEKHKVASKGKLLMRDMEAIDIIRKCIFKHASVIESGEC